MSEGGFQQGRVPGKAVWRKVAADINGGGLAWWTRCSNGDILVQFCWKYLFGR